MKKFMQLLFALALVFSMMAPSQVAQAQQSTLAPLGTDLGDVGQYYSGIAPSMRTRVNIRNVIGSPNTTTVKVYDDIGTLKATYSCNLAADHSMEFYFGDRDGKIYARGTDANLSGSNCPTAGHNGNYYGVYSMIVDGAYNIAVSVQTWAQTGAGYVQTNASKGAYKAVRDVLKSTTVWLPALYLDRDGLWDTEVIVFNPGASAATITFNLCPDAAGSCLNNNSAVIGAKEHRIFLLSQLAYRPSGGNLVEQEGYFGGRITSNQVIVAVTNVFKHTLSGGKLYAENGADRFFSLSQPYAATTRYLPGVFVNNSADVKVRVVNAANATNNVTLYMYDDGGVYKGAHSFSLAAYKGAIINGSTLHTIGGTGIRKIRVASSQNAVSSTWQERTEGVWGWISDYAGIAAHYFPMFMAGYFNNSSIGYNAYQTGNSSVAWYGHKYDGGTASGSLGTAAANKSFTLDGRYNPPLPQGKNYSVKVSSTSSTAIGVAKSAYFGSGASDSANAYSAITALDDVWHVPFAPAPVREFEWDPGASTGDELSAWYGIAPKPVSNQEPWVKDLNWYRWYTLVNQSTGGLNIGEFNSLQADCNTNQRGLIMNKGLVAYDTPNYNQDNRMKAIRNSFPSACAGRPALLANEPDFTNQANMTHPEVARQVWLHRSWPGELYSPAYGDIADLGRYGPSGDGDVGLGQSDPTRTDFNTFESYWRNTLGWGNLPFDGLAIHTYTWKEFVPTTGVIAFGNHMAVGLRNWRDRARKGPDNVLGNGDDNWPVLVTEYNTFPWEGGDPNNSCNASCLADRIDVWRASLRQYLDTYGAIKKAMVFSYYDNGSYPGGWNWYNTKMFTTNDTSGVLTNPLGNTWYTDAKNNP